MRPTRIKGGFMKPFLKIACLFVVIYLLGQTLWPFLSYLTGIDIGVLIYWITFIGCIMGLSTLIFAIIRKTKKTIALWIIICSLSCIPCLSYIYDCYGENGRFIGDYMEYCRYDEMKWPNVHGIVNKWGRKIIDPRFAWVVQIFSNKSKTKMFVGIQRHQIENETDPSLSENTFDLYFFDEDCILNNTVKIEDSKYENIMELIENEYGNILYDFDRYGHNFTDSETRIRKDGRGESHVVNQEGSVEEQETDGQKITEDKEEYDVMESKDVEVSHVHQKQQVWKERWNPCISCDPNRKGRCNNCHGQGGYYIGNIYSMCGCCNGTGACPWCGGRGEILETYSVWE